MALRNHTIPVVCYCHTTLRLAHDLNEVSRKQYPFPKRFIFDSMISLYKLFERRAWKWFDLVVCNSFNTSRRVKSANLADQTTIVHPGVDTNRFVAGKKHTKMFLCPSRFKKYKRQHIAVSAFKEFKKKHKGYSLMLLGDVGDASYYDQIRKQIESDPDIHMMTKVDDEVLIKLYQECFAVIFPAKNEDWGIVPLEAMSCGKPVLGFREGGLLESIKDGSTGFLASDVTGLIRSMGVLVEDPKIYTKMCVDGRKAALNYDWSVFTEALDSILDTVVRKN